MKKFILLIGFTARYLQNSYWLKNIHWILVFSSFLSVSNVQADTVQRWQDRTGQWHFGDYAAAKGQRSQAVVIKNPISVVKNEQPNEKPIKQGKTGTTHRQRTKPQNKTETAAQRAAVKAKANCEKLRNRLTQSGSNTAKRQATQIDLNNRYERECIAGHYYGS